LLYGLNTVALNAINNITTGKTSSYSFIKFSLKILLIYNVTIPSIQNQSFFIEQSQKASLTRCKFQVENITITSIDIPLEAKFIVKLNTGSIKKRATFSDCSTYQAEFATVCSDSSQLTQCNQTGLNIFLNSYISQSVNISIKIF
jgi:hypothetical protein